jgi:hypothetical protein
MADQSRSSKEDLIARFLLESCIYPFQGTVMHRAAGSTRRRLSLEECLLPYSGLLYEKLKAAA